MFYVEEARHERAELRGETARHLRKVLRAECGYRCEVSDNESLWLAEVEDLGRDEVTFKLLERLAPPRLPVEIRLYASLVKFDAFEWMLEKATELGAASITPVYALRTDKGLDEAALKRNERWQRIVFESGQQSRRIPRPELHAPLRLAEALSAEAISNDAAQRLFCDEDEAAAPLLAGLGLEQPVAVMIGPEGGWDSRERDAAHQAGWRSVSLGPQILRAETAVCAALAVISARFLLRAEK